MGSYTNAPMTGFICRVCSEHKQSLIHFFGVKASSLMLLDKLRLLPITVTKHDNLPKTLCEDCMEKLTAQYELVQKIRRSIALQNEHSRHHRNGNCPRGCPLFGIWTMSNPSRSTTSAETDDNTSADELNVDIPEVQTSSNSVQV